MNWAVHYVIGLAGLVLCTRSLLSEHVVPGGTPGGVARFARRFDVSRAGRMSAAELRRNGLEMTPSIWAKQQLMVFVVAAGVLAVVGAGLMALGIAFTVVRLVGGLRRRRGRNRRDRQAVEVAVGLGRRIHAELTLQRSLEEAIRLAKTGSNQDLVDSILEYAARLVDLGDRGGDALRAAATRYSVADDPAMVAVLAALEHPGSRTEWIVKVMRTVAEDSEQRNKVVSGLMEARVVAVALPVLTLIFAATLVSIDPATSAVLGSGMAMLLCAGCAAAAGMGATLVTRMTAV